MENQVKPSHTMESSIETHEKVKKWQYWRIDFASQNKMKDWGQKKKKDKENKEEDEEEEEDDDDEEMK